MEIIRDLVPAAARKVIYAIYIVAGLVVGAFSVVGGFEWTGAAEAVLAYLAVPLAVLAGTNVNGSPANAWPDIEPAVYYPTGPLTAGDDE